MQRVLPISGEVEEFVQQKRLLTARRVKIVKISFTIPFCHNYLFGMQAGTLLILLCLVVLLCMNMHINLPTE
jgi:hypothetical protein